MTTELPKISDQLMAKVKEAAEREKISVEELVCDALERRVNGRQGRFAGAYAIAARHAERSGITTENIEAILESEVAAHRQQRSHS